MLPLGREAVRVRVLKYDCKLPPDVRKFSVDPQITSLDEMRSIVATAFDICSDEFSLSYKSSEEADREDYLALLTDWDLDTAFLRAQNASCLSGSEPCIHLRVDKRQSSHMSSYNSKEMRKSDPNLAKQYNRPQKSASEQINELKQMQMGFQGMLMNHMEKTLNMVSKALNFSDGNDAPPRPPLSQQEFLSFLSPVGHVIHGEKMREAIYNGGVEPSFRKVAWKHILNVYPDGMSGKERLDYMKKKSAEYYSLRDVWRDSIQKNQISADLTYVTNMVRKDVLRTDRHHKFYSGTDDNQNITILFNILTTYALNHPTVSYCQGMSDLASPLLVVMENEAHTYVCLCALMIRLRPNFLLDGEAMTLKFSHLSESLQIYDPIFYAYLQAQQADDLLFCYRWLLLEMKREFAFEDALHMLEVLWSSIPSSSKPPQSDLPLKEKESESLPSDCDSAPISPLCKNARENAYSKLCAIRRQNSSYNFASTPKGKLFYRRMNHSLDENIGKGSSAIQMCKEFQSLDETSVRALPEVGVKKNGNFDYKDLFMKLFENNIADVDDSNAAKESSESRSNSAELEEKAVIPNGFSLNKNCDNLVETENNANGECSYDVTSVLNSEKQCEKSKECDVPAKSIEKTDIVPSHFEELPEKTSDECFVWENPLHDTNPFKNYTPSDDAIVSPKQERTSESASPKSIDTKPKLASRDSPRGNSKFFSSMSQELENARKNCEILLQSNKHAANLQSIASMSLSQFQKKYDAHDATAPCEEIREGNSSKDATMLLPPANEFGGGNPFLIFLSLTLLMQHRDYIMRNQMDYNELAMYFDKMVRKHNVNRVLNQARQLYSAYLKEHSKD